MEGCDGADPVAQPLRAAKYRVFSDGDRKALGLPERLLPEIDDRVVGSMRTSSSRLVRPSRRRSHALSAIDSVLFLALARMSSIVADLLISTMSASLGCQSSTTVRRPR